MTHKLTNLQKQKMPTDIVGIFLFAFKRDYSPSGFVSGAGAVVASGLLGKASGKG